MYTIKSPRRCSFFSHKTASAILMGTSRTSLLKLPSFELFSHRFYKNPLFWEGRQMERPMTQGRRVQTTSRFNGANHFPLRTPDLRPEHKRSAWEEMDKASRKLSRRQGRDKGDHPYLQRVLSQTSRGAARGHRASEYAAAVHCHLDFFGARTIPNPAFG